MTGITLINLIGRAIPELLLFNWAFFVLSQTKFDVKKYSKSCLLFLISNCIIRSLPIQFGIHTLLFLVVYIVINTKINKIPTIKSITVSVGVFIVEFICEIINFEIVNILSNGNMLLESINSISSLLASYISLVLFVLIIYLIKIIMIKMENRKLYK